MYGGDNPLNQFFPQVPTQTVKVQAVSMPLGLASDLVRSVIQNF